MKAYKDIFLDFDDTIYDTRGNAELALAELFDQCGWTRYFSHLKDFTEPYWRINQELWNRYSLGEIDRDHLIVERFRQPLLCGHGIDPTRAYCLQVSDLFLDLCSRKSGLVPGAMELLQYFRHSQLPVHICSNGFRETQQRKADVSGVAPYFTTMVLSEDVGYNKPALEFYNRALEITGARPETTLMIGDSLLTDISGARRAGIDTLYFNRWGTTDHEAVTYRVDRLVDIIALFEREEVV